MGTLTINCGTSFTLSNSDSLRLVLTPEAVHIRSSPCNPHKHPHLLTLTHERVSNSEEPEHNDAAMEALVDINSQGTGNLDDCDVSFDGDESDGNDIIEDGRAEVFEYECCQWGRFTEWFSGQEEKQKGRVLGTGEI